MDYRPLEPGTFVWYREPVFDGSKGPIYTGTVERAMPDFIRFEEHAEFCLWADVVRIFDTIEELAAALPPVSEMEIPPLHVPDLCEACGRAVLDELACHNSPNNSTCIDCCGEQH